MHHRAQSSLIILQTALTLVLLVGAGLLFRTMRHLWSVNPGFETYQLVSFKAGISPDLTKTPEAMRIAYRQLMGRIQQLPGVQSADLTTLARSAEWTTKSPFGWIRMNLDRLRKRRACFSTP